MPAAPCGQIWSPVWVGLWEDVAGKIDVTMVSSTAPAPPAAGSLLQGGRKEGRPPGSRALASRNLCPTASSPASHNGVSGKQGPLQDLGTIAPCSLKTHLHYADDPFQTEASYSCSSNPTHSELSVKNSGRDSFASAWLARGPPGSVPEAATWDRRSTDFRVGCG